MACPKIPKFEDCKDPDSKLPYSFTWTEWTTAESTTLVDDPANWDISISLVDDTETDTTPLLVDSVVVDVIDSIIYVWLTGGTTGLQYYVECLVTFANGMIEPQTGIITCTEK